jgi:type IX secretion system PorP/SprF family membrane protein
MSGEKKMEMKKKLIIIIALIYPMIITGQTDIQMSQHMLNRTTYNPASTGASRYVNVYGHWRDQWQGFSGGPQTVYLTGHTYFPELKSGIGITATKDKLGDLERNMLFKFSYAYHLYLNKSSYLSFGLSAGVLNRNIDWIKRQLADPDPNLPNEVQNRWSADFDFGIEYNMERFTAGLSITHINRTSDESTPLNMGHHFYGYLKYKFGLGVDFELVPAIFAQNSKKSTHIESNMLLYYRNRAWIGFSYRADEKIESESAVVIAGIDLMNFLRIGYSFDYNIGKIGKNGGNTHEIMLGIRLNRPQKIYAKSPRFFE